MKTFKLSIFLFLFSITSTTTFAQTADEIVSKYIKKIGGADNLKKVKGVKMEMTASLEGMHFSLETVKQNEEKCTQKWRFFLLKLYKWHLMEILYGELDWKENQKNLVQKQLKIRSKKMSIF